MDQTTKYPKNQLPISKIVPSSSKKVHFTVSFDHGLFHSKMWNAAKKNSEPILIRFSVQILGRLDIYTYQMWSRLIKNWLHRTAFNFTTYNSYDLPFHYCEKRKFLDNWVEFLKILGMTSNFFAWVARWVTGLSFGKGLTS